MIRPFQGRVLLKATENTDKEKKFDLVMPVENGLKTGVVVDASGIVEYSGNVEHVYTFLQRELINNTVFYKQEDGITVFDDGESFILLEVEKILAIKK